MGAIVKIFVRYETAFWRDAGYDGSIFVYNADDELAAFSMVRGFFFFFFFLYFIITVETWSMVEGSQSNILRIRFMMAYRKTKKSKAW